jgi:two-component system chemotaxis response regulator CheY
MKVLIADDDIVTRTMLRTLLVKRGHQVIEMEDGRGAWESVCASHTRPGEQPIQFVISDWMMPGLDGPSLVGQIRLADFPRYTYIVMLTARNAVEDTVTGLEAGADDYLTKPFHPNEFRARVAIGERILSLETRLRDANHRLEEMATHDSLTGLLNRRALYDLASRELARAQREGLPLSVIMIDLDHFKQINDNYGHLTGDQALRQAGDVLAKGLREYDLLGRWGGEEFLMVLSGTDVPESLAVAERLRDEITHSPLQLADGRWVAFRASFGVTTLPRRNSEIRFDTLVHDADRALYEAKRRGRNRVYSFSAEPLANIV